MLPQFSVLKKMYLGNIDYGGLYSDWDVKQYLFKENDKRSNIPDNGTCILRMSAVLNITTREPESQQGLKNYYYIHERDELLNYLKKMYGAPDQYKTKKDLSGKVGIIAFKVNGSEASEDCSVLLWNGNGVHQGRGPKNFQSAELWAAPTGVKLLNEYKQRVIIRILEKIGKEVESRAK